MLIGPATAIDANGSSTAVSMASMRMARCASPCRAPGSPAPPTDPDRPVLAPGNRRFQAAIAYDAANNRALVVLRHAGAKRAGSMPTGERTTSGDQISNVAFSTA